MRKPCLDRNGKPIYVMGGSDDYKEGYDNIKWSKQNERNNGDTTEQSSNHGYRVRINGKLVDK